MHFGALLFKALFNCWSWEKAVHCSVSYVIFILRSSFLKYKVESTLEILTRPRAWPHDCACSVLFLCGVCAHCWKSPCTGLQGSQWSQGDGYMDIPVCGNLGRGTENRFHRKIFCGVQHCCSSFWAIQEWFMHCFPGLASLFDKAANLTRLYALHPKHLLTKAAL